MSEYKNGRGDYYLAEGLREQKIDALKDALSWADFGKNDGGFDNGQPDKNVRQLLVRLEELGYRIVRA